MQQNGKRLEERWVWTVKEKNFFKKNGMEFGS
jgi:hypothetical protein